MPRRPRRKIRSRQTRGERDDDVTTDRYMRSPYDPWNRHVFSGMVFRRLMNNPPRRGAGRWYLYGIAVTMIATAVIAMLLANRPTFMD